MVPGGQLFGKVSSPTGISSRVARGKCLKGFGNVMRVEENERKNEKASRTTSLRQIKPIKEGISNVFTSVHQ